MLDKLLNDPIYYPQQTVVVDKLSRVLTARTLPTGGTVVPEIWSKALHRLSEKVAQQNFEMWLRPIQCTAIEGHVLCLQAPNPYVRLWFENNYLAAVLEEVRTVTGDDYSVEFSTASVSAPAQEPVMEQAAERAPASASSPLSPAAAPRFAPEPPPQPPSQPLRAVGSIGNAGSVVVQHSQATGHPAGQATGHPAGQAAGQAAGQHPAGHRSQSGSAGGLNLHSVAATNPATPATASNQAAPMPGEGQVNIPLNPRYNFDTFVAGPSNQLAYAAAQAAASTYPPKYNPVFVCGGVGLGKTHLLHAIGHHILATRPGSRLLYLSGEQFMNEYIHAIRTNCMHEFRRSYREDCDVLLVDDVQFLAGKDGTQDEFFHTFNALHDTHRQIVLTADRKPYEISDIADRLRTRFAWGLLADIEPPELEVRVAILRKKAAAESIHMPDDVALYIAGSIKSNVRELEGALIRLAAYASLSRKEITIDFARETLEGSITRPPEHLTTDHILKAVASYYNVKISDLKSPRRHKSIAGPRAVAMYLARTHTSESYPDLGRSFGGKHHTTVISAVEKITRRLQDEATLRGEVHAVESLLLR